MRICFLAHAASIHTRRWATFFRDRGHEVHVISLTPDGQIEGIRLHLLGAKIASHRRTNWHYLWNTGRLWSRLRALNPDLVNAHFLSSYGFLGAVTRLPNVPFVVSLHGSDILTIPERSFAHRWVAKYALRKADLITSVAHHMTRVVREYLGKDTPVLTLQYGVDTGMFYPGKSGNPQAPTCISTRAMVPNSNLDTILEAASLLTTVNSPLTIGFAGEGPAFPQLKHRASELMLGERVQFFGPIPHEQMPGVLRRSAIYVSMTASDGTSLSLLEAMACGTFPVVSDIAANREWIEHGVNGLLVSLSDVAGLADAIQQAWLDEKLRRRASEHNWDLIRAKADYQTNMRVIERAYVDLMKA